MWNDLIQTVTLHEIDDGRKAIGGDLDRESAIPMHQGIYSHQSRVGLILFINSGR
jgi:hypothetical protein